RRLHSIRPARRGRTHVAEEIGPLDQLHREEPLTVIDEQFPHSHQIRVLQILKAPKFSLESQQRMGSQGGEQLERNPGPTLAIECLVHNPQPSRAESAKNAEALCAAKDCRLDCSGSDRYLSALRRACVWYRRPGVVRQRALVRTERFGQASHDFEALRTAIEMKLDGLVFGTAQHPANEIVRLVLGQARLSGGTMRAQAHAPPSR